MTKVDCYFIVADADMEAVLSGLLSKPQKLGCHPFTYQIHRAAHLKDCGLLSDKVHDSLRFAQKFADRLVVMVDYEGSNIDNIEEARCKLQGHFDRTGWDKAMTHAVILNPELEIWLWQDNPNVMETLGWKKAYDDLRQYVKQKHPHYWLSDKPKPDRPKETWAFVLEDQKKAKSSSLFKKIAENVTLKRCTDKAFLDFQTQLLQWFPLSTQQERL